MAPENSKIQENNTTAEMRRPGEKNKTETGGINKSSLRISIDPGEHNYITESAAYIVQNLSLKYIFIC